MTKIPLIYNVSNFKWEAWSFVWGAKRDWAYHNY